VVTVAATTRVVRAEVERACEEFTVRLAHLRFLRTKTMLWTRSHPATVDFIRLVRNGSSYGAPSNYSVTLTVECGIRVLNSTFVAPVPNGPTSDAARSREGRYHLRFNAHTGSTFERCLDDLVRFVREHGEPWFQRFGETQELLTSSDSPLTSQERELLAAALGGRSTPENEAASRRLLGIQG
jgi:hypothetical protein